MIPLAAAVLALAIELGVHLPLNDHDALVLPAIAVAIAPVVGLAQQPAADTADDVVIAPAVDDDADAAAADV
eukprot:4125-Heterococcus_DN1.PRE.3